MRSGVTQLYELFPFISSDVHTPLEYEVEDEMRFILKDNCLDGWQVLDAGCGTGHSLVARAQRWPEAHFVGVDASRRSLDIAQRLAKNCKVDNVEFVLGSIPEVALGREFDFIICWGVLPVMPDPQAGLRWLCEHLADDGLLRLWLYNSLGEHARMLDRELVQLFTSVDQGASALKTVRALGFTLSSKQYGFPDDPLADPLVGSIISKDTVDADAYLVPIVHTMRFTDMPALFEGLDAMWVAPDRVYFEGGVKFIDLGDTENDRTQFVGAEELFNDINLRQQLRSFSNLKRMQALELRLRPAGFELLAGCGDSLKRCVSRVRHNLLLSEELLSPGMREEASGIS